MPAESVLAGATPFNSPLHPLPTARYEAALSHNIPSIMNLQKSLVSVCIADMSVL